MARRGQLGFLAQRLDSVELNGPFYALQSPASYRRWYDETPDAFTFAVKGARFVTHFKRLRDVETALANFFASGVGLLADKLGPILWQLPARLEFDPVLLGDFLNSLPRTAEDLETLAAGHDAKVKAVSIEASGVGQLRHAIEVRHRSFLTEDFFALVRRQGVACVLADSAGHWPQIDRSTADFDYIRLHGHTELYASRYSDQSLDRWANRCTEAAAQGRDVYVYFDNDARGHAPHDAERLARRIRDLGSASG